MIRASAAIEQRLARHGLLLLAILMLLLTVLVELGAASVARQFVTTRLQHDAESLITGLSVTPAGQWQLDPGVLPPVYQRPYAGHYYVVQVQGQMLTSRSLWDYQPAPSSLVRLAPGENELRHLPGPEGQQWQVWQEGAQVQGADVTLMLAEDVTPVVQWVAQFRWQMLAVVAITLVLYLLLQRQVLRRSFAQLRPLREAIQAQREGQAGAFPETVPAEVQPLASAIEDLMQRYRAQLARSRQTLGNLAHELKRPLQQLQWLAEQEADATRRQQLTALYQQLNRQLERELRRARIAGDPQPLSPFYPARELPALQTLLARIHRNDRQLDCQWGDDAAPPTTQNALPFDRDDMLELLGNLLDNAWRHAESRIVLAFKPPSAGEGELREWRIVVEDDGPGIPGDQRSQLLQRGARLDESDAASEGAGLGLSICQAVVASYHGDLALAESPLGGLRVTIALPAAAS